jgi:hypothetical protein
MELLLIDRELTLTRKQLMKFKRKSTKEEIQGRLKFRSCSHRIATRSGIIEEVCRLNQVIRRLVDNSLVEEEEHNNLIWEEDDLTLI